MARTAFLYHSDFLDHDNGPGHPECPQRLVAIMERLESGGGLDHTLRLPPQPASVASIERLHAPEHR